MTEERKKVHELESNYEQVWEDIDEKETEKRQMEYRGFQCWLGTKLVHVP